ncbi:hypothetical protein RI367_006842 [Sorochytrium milnesiophthora]
MGSTLAVEVQVNRPQGNSARGWVGLKLAPGTPVDPENLQFVKRHSDRLEVPEKLAKDAEHKIDLGELMAVGRVELKTWPTDDDLAIGHELVYGTESPELANAFEVVLDKSESAYKLVVKHKRLHDRMIVAKSQIVLKVFVPRRRVSEKAANGQRGSLDITTRSVDVEQSCDTLPSLDCFNGTIRVVTTSAEQHFGRIGRAQSIALSSDNGSIAVEQLTAREHVTIKTRHGGIKVDQICGATDVALYTTTGELSCNEISATGRVTLESTVGGVYVHKVTGATDALLTATAGEVCVGSVTARDSLTIQTSLGSIKAKELLKAAIISLQTSSGSINTPQGSPDASDLGIVFSDSLSCLSSLGSQSIPWAVLVDNEKAKSTPGPVKVSFTCTTGTVSVDSFKVASSRPFNMTMSSTLGGNTLCLADPCPSFVFDLHSSMGQARVVTQQSWTPIDTSNTHVSGRVGDNKNGNNITSSSTLGNIKLKF